MTQHFTATHFGKNKSIPVQWLEAKVVLCTRICIYSNHLSQKYK